MTCVHEFDIKTVSVEVYPEHMGEWGGVQHGHQCCGQCKGAVNLGPFRVGDGRCHGACGGRCNFTRKQTETWSICRKCGKGTKQ